ncbi:flagellar motor protein MotB [Paenibacillus sp. GP183]|uniref:OmpA/MotB family protein n=1 Tax=Paenibacillus sp. GP183 TaxID=1882751 RepID=UPI000898A84E|nr:flagellar motor protein MotB [Paenibacillus sp. GP183]SEC35345.1 chemotaxis protein MotB [Paenibacillus sp. GP183]
MARKKKHEEHINHERWLITYADLITLLLVFFIIMYAMSKIDTEKYTILAQSLNLQFTKGDSIIPKGNGISGQITPTNGDGKTEGHGTSNQDLSNLNNVSIDKEKQDKDKKEKELQDLLQKINTYIVEQNLQTQLSAVNTDRGIAITLNDLFLFDLGKADLKPASFPILQKLATLFPTLNSTISIEGHTDNLPLNTGSPLIDNWGLSGARSLSVLRYFKNKAGLDDRKFISTGYGDTKPKVTNDTAENRAKNRRVEIIVLRNDPIVTPAKDPVPQK